MNLLDGKYEILRLLGQGGMGAVYEARNVRTGRRVAVKTLIGTLAHSIEAVQRFMREARAASAIEHIGVLQIHDVGTTDGAPYLVMELLQGESLEDLLKREPRQDPRQFFQTIALALGALACAHRAGIVHRDLKPENIFLARQAGTRGVIPKLLDFGISKLNVEGELGLTKSHAMLGTPLYISPEQATGSKYVTHRADLYSLGVIFYHALSGEFPVMADSLGALIAKLLTESPQPLSLHRPDLSPALNSVVMRAMARDPLQRFASVEDFVRAYAIAMNAPDLVEAASLPEGVAVIPTESSPPPQRAVETPAPPMPLGSTSVMSQPEIMSLQVGASQSQWVARQTPSFTAWSAPMSVSSMGRTPGPFSMDAPPLPIAAPQSASPSAKPLWIAFAALGLLLVAGGAGVMLTRPDAPTAEVHPASRQAPPGAPRPGVVGVVPAPALALPNRPAPVADAGVVAVAVAPAAVVHTTPSAAAPSGRLRRHGEQPQTAPSFAQPFGATAIQPTAQAQTPPVHASPSNVSPGPTTVYHRSGDLHPNEF